MILDKTNKCSLGGGQKFTTILGQSRDVNSYKISNYNMNKDYENASLNTRIFS